MKNQVIIREMIEDDVYKGFLECLTSLSPVMLSYSEAIQVFRTRKESGVKTVVAVADNIHVVGTASLILEQKYIRRGGRVGHIEDVAVHKEWQGKGIGKMLVEYLVKQCKCLKCYKVILDCKKDLAGFYEPLGFKEKEVCMRLDCGV